MTAPDMSNRIDALALQLRVPDLAAALALWATRDDSLAQPEVRRAANHAVDAIDTAMAELYAIRGRLAGEIRESDDAAMARVDALLARGRGEVS